MKKKTIPQLIDESLSNGWKMYKKVSSGGLFSSPTYDIRTVNNREDLFKLTKEGFTFGENTEAIMFNVLMKL